MCFVFVVLKQIIPTKMKRVLEEGEAAEGDNTGNEEEVMVDTVVRGFVSDWDAMEDLLHHVLYTNIGWEIGDEGQILFTEPLLTPKALSLFLSLIKNLAGSAEAILLIKEKHISSSFVFFHQFLLKDKQKVS
jgi:actin-related protein